MKISRAPSRNRITKPVSSSALFNGRSGPRKVGRPVYTQ